MSLSPTCNFLYCTEEAGDLVSLDADICDDFESCGSFVHVDDDEENYIVSIFDSELDQLQGHELFSKYGKLPGIVTSRQEAIKWMLKVHSHYRFQPETAYLSVNYLDRFVLSHNLTGKEWHWRLLSVACLSLAAKMEETSVPLLLDLQLIEPRFLFKPKTVQRMELLVGSSLKWRLRSITPFDFLHYFISKISYCSSPQHSNGFSSVISAASDLIISTSRVIDFLDYPPSTTAAAVVLWVTNQPVDDHKLECLHKRLNKDMVKRCYSLVKRNMSQLLHIKLQKLEHCVPSNDKLGVSLLGRGDDETKSTKACSEISAKTLGKINI
ncbi:cyclin-D4-1-like [Pistacia vera]|uniref:cyclin-D4-1-like n=1 Tax=Pistacia vera TaxID=55513 RepID=UPI0012639B5F|nr:cyclin-D4-1-like [Pistacia vera]